MLGGSWAADRFCAASAGRRIAGAARPVQVGGPLVHELAPAREQVGAGVGHLDLVPDHVRHRFVAPYAMRLGFARESEARAEDIVPTTQRTSARGPLPFELLVT